MGIGRAVSAVLELYPVAQEGYDLLLTPTPQYSTTSETASTVVKWGAIGTKVLDVGAICLTSNPAALISTKVTSCVVGIISEITEKYAEGTLGNVLTLAGGWNVVKLVVRGVVDTVCCFQIFGDRSNLVFSRGGASAIKVMDFFMPRCQSGRDPFMQRFRIYPEQQIQTAMGAINHYEAQHTDLLDKALQTVQMVHFTVVAKIAPRFHNHQKLTTKCSISGNAVYFVMIPNPKIAKIAYNDTTPCYERSALEAWVQNNPNTAPPGWPEQEPLPVTMDHFKPCPIRQRKIFSALKEISNASKPLLRIYVRQIREVREKVAEYQLLLQGVVT